MALRVKTIPVLAPAIALRAWLSARNLKNIARMSAP